MKHRHEPGKAHPVRELTPFQAQVLVAMRSGVPFDAWRVSKRRVATLYELEAMGLVAKGPQGWLDARLTAAGVVVRGAVLAALEARQGKGAPSPKGPGG